MRSPTAQYISVSPALTTWATWPRLVSIRVRRSVSRVSVSAGFATVATARGVRFIAHGGVLRVREEGSRTIIPPHGGRRKHGREGNHCLPRIRSSAQHPRTCGPGERRWSRMAAAVQPASSRGRQDGEAVRVEPPGGEVRSGMPLRRVKGRGSLAVGSNRDLHEWVRERVAHQSDLFSPRGLRSVPRSLDKIPHEPSKDSANPWRIAKPRSRLRGRQYRRARVPRRRIACRISSIVSSATS